MCTAVEETNIEAILAAMNTTELLNYWTTELVVEIRPEKNSGQYGIWTHDLCTGIAEVMGSNPILAWIFSGIISTTTSVVFIAAQITSMLVLFIFSLLEQIKIRYKWSEKVVDWSCSISWDALFWSVLKDFRQ